MRTLVRIALLWSTFALIGEIVWFPESFDWSDFLGYLALWIYAIWTLRREGDRSLGNDN